MKHHKLLQLIKDNASARADGKPVIRSEATDTELHLYVYDVIDSWWGASAADLIAGLADAGDRTVHLHINSPGGDVFEARAMKAALAAHPGNVISHIDGIAASAATDLALAANEVRISDGGLWMIHNSWTLAYGNKTELRSTADLLDKIDGTIAAAYVGKTGKALADVQAWMDAETWFTAEEAKAEGFVDFIDASTKRDSAAAANDQADPSRWNLSAYANAPKLAKPEPKLDDTQIAQQLQMNRNRLRLLDLAA